MCLLRIVLIFTHSFILNSMLMLCENWCNAVSWFLSDFSLELYRLRSSIYKGWFIMTGLVVFYWGCILYLLYYEFYLSLLLWWILLGIDVLLRKFPSLFVNLVFWLFFHYFLGLGLPLLAMNEVHCWMFFYSLFRPWTDSFHFVLHFQLLFC